MNFLHFIGWSDGISPSFPPEVRAAAVSGLGVMGLAARGFQDEAGEDVGQSFSTNPFPLLLTPPNNKHLR